MSELKEIKSKEEQINDVLKWIDEEQNEYRNKHPELAKNGLDAYSKQDKKIVTIGMEKIRKIKNSNQ